MSRYEDDEYEIPLKDQKYFGAGIKRKRVPFVAASDSSAFTAVPPAAGHVARDAYLNIVLKSKSKKIDRNHQPGQNPVIFSTATNDDKLEICPVCQIKLSQEGNMPEHAGRIAHQVCLSHSHPPSAVDRQRIGLSILETQGWNPDGRQGLGMAGQGILHPVSAHAKPDRLGLGQASGATEVKSTKQMRSRRAPPQRLDAGKVRNMERESRRKDEQMRDLFYRNDDVEKYLGNG